MWLYEFLLAFAFLLYLPKAVLKKRLPHRGWSMRLGRYPQDVRARIGTGGAIWVHAVSIGEVIAARPVIDRLRQAAPGAPIVLSTVTPAGYAIAGGWVGERGVAIYGPLDFRACVDRAIRQIRPALLVLVESEFWPTLIGRVRTQGVPIAVINGRVSTRAFGRYRMVARLLRGMLGRIDRFVMQTPTDAERVIAMGAPADRVEVLGSLKWDAGDAGRPEPSDVAALRARLGTDGRAVVVAGSTHRGEEAALAQAVVGLRGHFDGLRLVVAPRHIERADEVEAAAARLGLTVRRATRLSAAEPWDVLIVDTIGQLPQYYALATLVFIGGSLIPHGGQNPIEPASLGKPILFGPHMDNFAEIAQRLLAAQAARQLPDPNELTATLLELLTDPDRTAAMGRRALDVTTQARGVAQRTMERLLPLLRAPRRMTARPPSSTAFDRIDPAALQ
jgi:3-deoxy-D-manno-octulosonic-acid transferase